MSRALATDSARYVLSPFGMGVGHVVADRGGRLIFLNPQSAKAGHNLVKFRFCQHFEFLHVQPNDQSSWQCRFIPVPY